MVAKLDEGYDLVSGWRKNRQDKAISRKLPSYFANRLIGWMTDVRIHDYGCTLKAYRADMLKHCLSQRLEHFQSDFRQRPEDRNGLRAGRRGVVQLG